MGKYERKRERKRERQFTKWILVSCLMAMVVFLILFVMPIMLYHLNPEPDLDDITPGTTVQTQETETRVPIETQMPVETQMPTETKVPENDESATHPAATQVEFPVKLNQGNIEIESLFQFSGVNPDAENRDATDVASIVLTNTSNQYLSEATVKVTLATGSELTFVVQGIPSGASVMAFSTDNVTLLETDTCTAITVKTLFEDDSKPDGLDISVDGMTITVKNTSSKKLSNIDVYYRDIFDERYFGGKTYIYSIEHLSAGKSTTFTAEESLLGVIDVVHVAVNDKN